MKWKNIVLCGFMGCGKTTVGRRLAQNAGMEFIDMDQYIEGRQGKTIRDIFAQEGEEAFRQMEMQAAKELAQKKGLIIATGGGTLLRPQNVAILRQNTVIVLLDTPLPAIQERLKADVNRPLLQTPNRAQVIADLYRSRLPAYCAAADIMVEGGAPAERVAQDILQRLKKG